MKKVILITLLLIAQLGFAQKKKKDKCKLEYDKELGMDVYSNVDSIGTKMDDPYFDFDFMAHFKPDNLGKQYPLTQRVRFAHMIGTDGKTTLIKVIEPSGDKTLETEISRVLSLMPLTAPCYCNGQPVPCNGNMSFPIYSKNKKAEQNKADSLSKPK